MRAKLRESRKIEEEAGTEAETTKEKGGNTRLWKPLGLLLPLTETPLL